MTPEDIIQFWYSPQVKKRWFNSTHSFDREIKENYEYVWQMAVNDELLSWKESAVGCLALAIVLDQFPLNMYRDEKKSFSSEAKAIEISLYAIANDIPDQLPKQQLSFLFMPLMHSEAIADQQLSVQMFEKYQLVDNIRFAQHHHDLVKRFDRFPHRNKILERESTPEEIEYLNSANAFLG